MKRISIFLMILAVCGGLLAAQGKTTPAKYTVALAQMPVYAESTEKGVLVDFVKAIQKLTGIPIIIVVEPFPRAMDNVTKGLVDFEMPLIKNPTMDDNTLPYLHSTETIFHVNFVLYTNSEKPLNPTKLKGYIIETEAAHTVYFPFPTVASYDLESSIRKLNAGRIDGFIFADDATDPILAKLGFTNIKRILYQRFDVKIIIPRTAKSAETDAFLSDAIARLRASGEFQRIMTGIDHPYK